ncbi:chemotaxis protein CheW [Desulfoluna sp.]|uniref:chemotaxis protein CheW n=1 Tax=Desulfoluna sp. TaxID=2045199 RepID=UPI002605DADE|nr:chemotaxis protein CheW [Desulfoluna sp.]
MEEREKSLAGTNPGNGSSPPLEQLLAEITIDGVDPKCSESDAEGVVTAKSDVLSGGSEPYIRFVVDEVQFAVPLRASLEVGRLPGITRLPNLPPWVSGISNIRGDVVSIVDLKRFFGRSASTGTAGGHMILLHNDCMKVGFRVDRLAGIASLGDTEANLISNPFTKGDITPYLAGVATTDASLLYLLDVELLLTSERMNRFRRV